MRVVRLALPALFLLLCLATAFSPPASRAQLPSAGDMTSPPTPGVGHDYIHAPAETVNPANGSVSVRIPLRVPSGRELTIPLSIAYDSAGGFYYGLGQGGQGPGYFTITNSLFAQGGWSYTFPLLTRTTQSWTQDPGGGQRPYTCLQGVNYVFQDPTGNRHNLGLAPVNTTRINATCGTGGPGSKGGIDQGGEGPILAATHDSSTCCAPVTITDGNGTTYSFSGLQQTLATSIVDRNGNTISISTSGSSATFTDTVGRTAMSVGSFGGNPDSITVAGLSSTYQAYWTTASANFTISAFNLSNYGLNQGPCPTSLTGSANVISQVYLPNGQKYSFTYDSTYGMLNRITYPTGGYVRYAWGLNPQAEFFTTVIYSTDGRSAVYACRIDFPAITDRYVSFDGTTELLHQHFSYSTSWTSGTGQYTGKTTTVTTTDLVRNTSFTTVYSYSPTNQPCVPDLNPNANDDGCIGNNDTMQMPVEQCIEYFDSTGSGGTPPSPCPNVNPPGNLLRTVIKSWTIFNDPRTLGSVQTVLDNGQSSLVVNCYNLNEQLTESDSYDLGTSTPTLPSCAQGVPSGAVAGPLLRKTITNYATFTGAHIVDLPSSVITCSGSGTDSACGGVGTRVAETDSSYDQTALQSTSVVHHSSAPGGTARGNLTTVTKQCFNGGCGGGNPTTTLSFYDTGQIYQLTDPRNNVTTYSYTDSYTSCGGSAPPSGATNAYVTHVTYPQTNGVNHAESYCHDYSKGLMLSSTDQNGLTTNYTYADSFDRLTEVSYPDGGQFTYSYNDTPPTPTQTATKKLNSSLSVTTVTTMNGLGAAVKTQLTSDPDCSTGDETDTTYDGLGRVYTVSNPYCTTSDPTYGSTTYTYDALSRTTQVTHNPDNSTILTTYTGRATQVQDEGNGTRRVTRISQVDGLGRLASVCEVTSASQLGSTGTPAACGQDISATGFLTTYGYDTLDNLTSVSQSGLNSRSFQYDSLSRLTSASNPESGTITYTYDADSNVRTKTDARNTTATYAYDALNRLTGKTYSDSTPAATFNYDQTSALGVTLTNTIGRESSESTAGALPTGSVFSYDSMGRTVDNSQCTPQNCGTGVFRFQYPQHDFLGHLISGTNAAGVTFTYSYNGAARLTGITTNFVDASHPGTLLSSVTYNAPGLLKSVLLGNGITETRNYNPRLWMTSLTAGTVYSLNMTSYAPNADVLAANDSANGNWTYSYDDFNRLSGSNQNSGQSVYSYAYDRFGNRWQQNGQHSMQLSFSGANNRMNGYSYDASGNLLNDGSHNYFYDAENRLIQVDGTVGNCSTATACYVYDAEGRRVRKTTPAATLDFLYDTEGHKVAEVDTTGTFQRGELYASGRHFAIYAPDPGPTGATFFIHADWLGTERARTNMTGTACETIASLPFGDGQTISDSCGDSAGDVSPMHFTSKERDAESGLDDFGARYYSSGMGRFTSVDPVVITPERFYDPQQLNEYAYVRDNPTRLIDPTGMILQLSGNVADAKADLCQIVGEDNCSRVTVDDKTGVVTFDTKDLDLAANAGAALVNDLVQSQSTYDFSVGATVETAQGTLRIDHIANLDNNESHAPTRDIATPKKGVDDQVAIDPRVTTASDTSLKPAVAYTTVFHELAEAYAKVDHGKKYDPAHQEAIDREQKLRDQRPSLKEHNPGSGPGDRYKQIQPEQIIKK